MAREAWYDFSRHEFIGSTATSLLATAQEMLQCCSASARSTPPSTSSMAIAGRHWYTEMVRRRGIPGLFPPYRPVGGRR
jgi:hypothetical protein